MPIWGRRSVSWVCAIQLLFALGAAERADAQSFSYRVLNGTRTLPVVLDDSAWIQDIFPNLTPSGVDPVGPRYAPNLNQRIRILANPYVGSLAITYSMLRLNNISVGGLGDAVTLRWYEGSGSTTATGFPAVPFTMTLGTSSSNDLQSPGVLFTFRSGPSWGGAGAYFESEEGGIRTSGLQIIGAAPYNWNVSTLSAQERVLGVVQQTDDVVDMHLPGTTASTVVALWLENPNTWDVNLWARCGALPTATAFDAVAFTAPATSYPTWHGASVVLPACSTGWYLSVTNTSSTDRVFHLVPNQAIAERLPAAV